MALFRQKTAATRETATAGVPHFTKQYNDAETLAKCARGVWKCCGAFTPSMRLVDGLFFEFEAVRTESSDRDAPRR